MAQLAKDSTEKTQLQHELHSFNNHVFRVSLLSESLQWKLQAKGECDQPMSDLLGKIRAAVQDASASAKNLNTLVREQ